MIDIELNVEPQPSFGSNLNDVHEGSFEFTAKFVSVRSVIGSTVDLVKTVNVTGVGV